MRLFGTEVRSSISGLPPRLTGVLVAGVLLLQLLFIASYVGGLHAPRAHGAQLAVVGSPAAVARIGATVERATSGIDVTSKPDAVAARSAIDRGEVFGALFLGPKGDRLAVSQTWNRSFSTEVARKLTALYEQQGRPLVVEVVNPLPANDSNGLSPFYLVVGWVVGGYLAAVVLGLALGERAPSPRHALRRLGVLLAYAAVSGLLGALLVGPVMSVLEGHVLELWGIGTFIVFATAATTLALEGLFGVIGVGVAIALFVVLGNPASGAIFPSELLPQPWRTLGGYITTGAGGQATRSVQYFESASLLKPMLVLAVYTVVGAAVSVALAGRSRTAAG